MPLGFLWIMNHSSNHFTQTNQSSSQLSLYSIENNNTLYKLQSPQPTAVIINILQRLHSRSKPKSQSSTDKKEKKRRSRTIQREPVVLGWRQRGQCTGLVLKHHWVWDDLITDCHLQSHQPCVMGYRKTNRATHVLVIRAVQRENHRRAHESSASTSHARFNKSGPKRLYEPGSIKTVGEN